MNIYSVISSNVRKTWMIMILFVLFISTLGFIYGKAFANAGFLYAGVTFLLALVLSIGSYYFSDQLVLTITNAKRIYFDDNPQLFRIVENLSLGSGIPMPKIYIVEDNSPNAFATGRDPKHAAVGVTSGLLQLLNKVELEGVIAHELSHIKNYDIRLMTVVAVLVGFVALLADIFTRHIWYYKEEKNRGGSALFVLIGIIFAVISPLIATLFQLAISRKREFLADASGALLTRYPEGLANALEKIARNKSTLKSATNATAHLFLVNPFRDKKIAHWFSSLFNTHPPIEERIKILRSM